MKRFFIGLFFILFALTYLQAAKEKVSLQLQWLDQFQFAGYYIAKEKGFYDSVGLDVTIKKFNSSILTIQEVLSNNSEYAIGRSSLLIDKSNGKPIVALAAIFQSTPLILLAKKSSNIQTIKDIINKRIMLTEDALGTTSLRAMIMSQGVNFSQTKVQKHTLKLDDLIHDKTDLMASYISNEPYKLKKLGVETISFAPKDFGFKFYGDILFTSEKELIQHPARVKKFREASLKGWEYAFNNIDESVELILKKYNTQNKSKDELLYEAKELKKLAYFETNKIGIIDQDNINRIFDIYKVLGLTKNELDTKRFIYNPNNIVLNEQERSFLKNIKTLKVHNEMNWPPYNFYDKYQPKGYSIDIMNLLAKKLDLKIEYINGYSWNEFLELIKTKKIDVMLNIVNTKERSKYIKFTTNYAETLPSIFVLKNQNNTSSLKSLYGKTVAIPKGFYTQSLLEKKHPQIKLHLTKDTLEALKLLMFKKVDAVVSDYGVAIYLMEKNGISTIKALAHIEDKDFRSPLNIGVRNDMPILRDILQKGIELISEEEFITLRRKWFGNILQPQTLLPIKLSNEEKMFLKKKNSIMACIPADWMPYSAYNKNIATGIIPEYMQLISKKIDIPVKLIRANSRKEAQQKANLRQCDILPGTIISSSQLHDFKFTTSYIPSALVIATLDDKSFISNINDLKGKTIGVIDGSNYKEKLQNHQSNLKINLYDNITKGLKAVQEGEIFGLVDSLSAIRYAIEKQNLHNVKITGKLQDNWNLRIATRSDLPKLNSILQKAINAITLNEHNKIQNRWVTLKFENSFDYNLLIKIGLPIIAILIFIILYLWNVKLKKAIRKRKRVAKALENSIKNFQILVNSTIEALLILDEEHNCIEVNSAAVTLFKARNKMELIGKNIFDLVAPDSIQMVKDKITLDSNTPYEVTLMKCNKSYFPALVKGQNSQRNNETIRIASIIDLSELKQKDKMLQQQSSLAQMGEMISMIAHQWRQPLGSIAATAISIKTKIALELYDFSTKKGQTEHLISLEDSLNKIEHYVKNLSTTIDDFRNFYKPNKKKQCLEINKPITQALSIIEISLRSKGIYIELDLQSKRKIKLYHNEMMQVILNLLKNSQDNLEENIIKNGKIIIKTYDLAENTIIELSDNGSGISPEIISKIFEPYFSTKDSKNGTGLGLYMSKTIIEEHHNGKLTVFNNENEGVTFEINLPTQEASYGCQELSE